MKVAIVVFSSIVIFFSAAGIVAIKSELRSDEEKNHELAIASMDKCSKGVKTRRDPLEWMKCVEYSAGYAPLKDEDRYLNAFMDFNSEVRRRLVKAACSEDPVVHYSKEGPKNPNAYLMIRLYASAILESLQIEMLRASGVEQDDLRLAKWNWARFIGASESLNKAIQFSGSRDYEEKEFALTEYLEQLRQVIYRSSFKEDIASMCPEKLADFSRPIVK